MRICHKCKKPVSVRNDGGHIGYLVFSDPTGLQCGPHTTHFLPVVENGIVLCEGSPYRAQYLEGQPRDKRHFLYFKSSEAPVRAAYQKLQALAKAMAIAKETEKNHPASS